MNEKTGKTQHSKPTSDAADSAQAWMADAGIIAGAALSSGAGRHLLSMVEALEIDPLNRIKQFKTLILSLTGDSQHSESDSLGGVDGKKRNLLLNNKSVNSPRLASSRVSLSPSSVLSGNLKVEVINLFDPVQVRNHEDALKVSLRRLINALGGVSAVAKLMGVPQSSLSRSLSSGVHLQAKTLKGLSDVLGMTMIEVDKP